MKKNVLGLLLSIVSVAGLVGCNNTESDEKLEVIWWNNYQTPDLATMTEEDARKKNTYREYYYAKDLIEAYEKEHTDVTIKTVFQGSYSEIKKKVDSALSGGSLPSIVSVYADNAYSWYESDALVDLTSFANELAKDSDFNQNYLSIEKGMYGNGAVLTLPYSKSGETFVYNETVFNKVGKGAAGEDKGTYKAPVAGESKTKYAVPTNWDEMIAIARKMKTDFPDVFKNQRDSNNYFTAVPFCWDSTENMFISLMQNAGIPYTASGDKIEDRVLFNNQQAKDLVVQLKKWNNEGLICTQNQLPISSGTYHEYGSNIFCKGNIFMSMSSTAGARYFTNDGFLANMTKALAWGNGTSAKAISQGPSLAFFKNKNSKVVDAALDFYKYLTNTTNSAELAVNTSYFPLRKSAADTTKVKTLTDAAATKPADNAAASVKGNYYAGTVMKLNDTYTANNSYFLSPVTEESGKCRTAVGSLINTVFDDKTATTDEEIKTLVDNAFKTAYTSVTK